MEKFVGSVNFMGHKNGWEIIPSHCMIPSNEMFDTPAKGASYLHSPEEPTIPTGGCSNYKKEHASSIQFKQTSEWQSMGGSTG